MYCPIRPLRPRLTVADPTTAPGGAVNPTEPITLLGVWAHPDDESYLSAVMMNRVVNAGGRVVLATATRGERGGADDPRQLADLRERELRAAMSVLGVDDVRLLGYADGECADADADEAVRSIADLIEDVHPDCVVTFGPDGITHHPDHIAVSRWTTAAAAAVGHQGLLYATMTDEFARQHDDLHTTLGVWMGGEPCPVPAGDLALHVVPTRREREFKGRALRAHSSQVSALIEMIGADAFDDWWVDEFFRLPTADELVAEQRVGAGPWLAI
jgi:LmbE family N-acetylglucosaminyl deacetylase